MSPIINLFFPVAQLVEHGVSNAKIMGSIPRESKSWICFTQILGVNEYILYQTTKE